MFGHGDKINAVLKAGRVRLPINLAVVLDEAGIEAADIPMAQEPWEAFLRGEMLPPAEARRLQGWLYRTTLAVQP